MTGLVLINIFSSSFLTVSGIRLDLSAIYLESVIYITGVIAAALTVFYLTLAIFRRRTLNASIRGNKKILRKTSIVVQLTVSIVFTFCTIIILKQMYYLHNSTDLGFSFKNRGAVGLGMDQMEVLNDKLKQIPEIKETVVGYPPLLPIWNTSTALISDWDGKQGDVEPINIFDERLSGQYTKFHEFKLVEGEYLKDDDYIQRGDVPFNVLINESAVKAFGWDKAVGKSFGDKYNIRVVKGVVKDIYKFSPTIAARPFYYYCPVGFESSFVLFKYDEGSWKTIKDILDIFFREHLSLLAICVLIAFPVGYIIMKPWLEGYVIQTEISAWIYLSILLALMLVIILCVGGRIYKTSRENPVNALNR